MRGDDVTLPSMSDRDLAVPEPARSPMPEPEPEPMPKAATAGESPPRLRAAAACVACNKKKVRVNSFSSDILSGPHFEVAFLFTGNLTYRHLLDPMRLSRRRHAMFQLRSQPLALHVSLPGRIG